MKISKLRLVLKFCYFFIEIGCGVYEFVERYGVWCLGEYSERFMCEIWRLKGLREEMGHLLSCEKNKNK